MQSSATVPTDSADGSLSEFDDRLFLELTVSGNPTEADTKLTGGVKVICDGTEDASQGQCWRVGRKANQIQDRDDHRSLSPLQLMR